MFFSTPLAKVHPYRSTVRTPEKDGNHILRWLVAGIELDHDLKDREDMKIIDQISEGTYSLLLGVRNLFPI